MIFYAQRKSIDAGTPKTPVNKYGTREEMEYQFHLFCASAVKTELHEVDAIEWGTVEQGVIERKKYLHTPEPEPEPEPVEPEEPEPTEPDVNVEP